MKKKLGRQLLVSLFVFTLFISVSNAAEIIVEGQTTLTPATNLGAVCTELSTPTISSDTKIYNALRTFHYSVTSNQWAESESFDIFKDSLLAYYNEQYSESFDSYWLEGKYNNNRFALYLFDSSEFDWFISSSLTGRGFTAFEGSSFVKIEALGGSSYMNYYYYSNAANNQVHYTNYSGSGFATYPFRSDANIKQISGYSGGSVSWDGETYYQYVKADEPDLPEITNEEVQNVVNLLLNSAYLDNRASDENSYFIVYDASDGFYYAYFYPDMYNLAYYYVDGNNEPTGTAEGTAYGFVQYTSSESFRDKVYNFISPWKYKEYTYHPDYMKTFVFAEEYSSSMNKFFKYFNPETTQIVYSSKNIPLLVTDPDDSNELIVDASGENDIVPNEIITSDVPVNEKPVTTGALSSFFGWLQALITEQVNLIIAAIELVITKFFDLPAALIEEFGENIFTLSVAIIGKAFQVLISSISLLVRFASFLLTLVTIPADSTLFNVAVDGNVWGTNFIEGLNFLKNLSWNNLNLWTLFECFVASLEVIWTVKVIRRHYSSIM